MAGGDAAISRWLRKLRAGQAAGSLCDQLGQWIPAADPFAVADAQSIGEAAQLLAEIRVAHGKLKDMLVAAAALGDEAAASWSKAQFSAEAALARAAVIVSEAQASARDIVQVARAEQEETARLLTEARSYNDAALGQAAVIVSEARASARDIAQAAMEERERASRLLAEAQSRSDAAISAATRMRAEATGLLAEARADRAAQRHDAAIARARDMIQAASREVGEQGARVSKTDLGGGIGIAETAVAKAGMLVKATDVSDAGARSLAGSSWIFVFDDCATASKASTLPAPESAVIVNELDLPKFLRWLAGQEAACGAHEQRTRQSPGVDAPAAPRSEAAAALALYRHSRAPWHNAVSDVERQRWSFFRKCIVRGLSRSVTLPDMFWFKSEGLIAAEGHVVSTGEPAGYPAIGALAVTGRQVIVEFMNLPPEGTLPGELLFSEICDRS